MGKPKPSKHMENEFETTDSTNGTEQTVNNDSSSELETLREQNRQLFARAKKAEGFVFENGEWIKPQPKQEAKPEVKATPQEINIADILALKDVHEDDIAEVQEYAKFKGISIREAKNSSVITTLLRDKAEQRKTAQATQVKSTRASAQTPSSDDIVNKAVAGDLPDDPAVLAAARQEQRLKKLTKR